MEEGRTPDFEQPDIAHLRESFHGPSTGQKVGSWFANLVRSRTFRTILLALLIVAALVMGYLALT